MTSGGTRSRRRTSASSVCRRWLLRGGLSGLLVALCLVGYEWVPSAVAGLMTVQHVSITGATRLDRRDILALLNLPGASSLLWLDRAQLTRQVEAHPWVASASVGRALPHTLSVVVVERQPAAWARHADGTVLVDKDGVVLLPALDVPAEDLPTLVGLASAPLLEGDPATRERIRRGLDFAECLRDRFGRPVTVDLGDARFLSGYTDSHVFLVNDAFQDAWRQYLGLESVLREGRDQGPYEFDLRFAGKLIVRTLAKAPPPLFPQ